MKFITFETAMAKLMAAHLLMAREDINRLDSGLPSKHFVFPFEEEQYAVRALFVLRDAKIYAVKAVSV